MPYFYNSFIRDVRRVRHKPCVGNLYVCVISVCSVLSCQNNHLYLFLFLPYVMYSLFIIIIVCLIYLSVNWNKIHLH